jgi:hypothetical protein
VKHLSRLVLATAIISTTGLAEKVNAEGFTVRAPNIEVGISNNGQVIGVLLGAKGLRWNLAGSTELAGCRVEGRIESTRKKGGIVSFKKHLTCDADGMPRKVTLSESFFPTKDSVRWEIDLAGHGQPCSTDIETRLRIPQDGTRKLWTTWGDPRPDEDVEPSWISDPSWQDPLVPTAFPNRKFWYGAAYYRYDKPRMGVPQPFRDVICIPLATVMDPLTDSGLSLALSPQDVTIEMTLETSANGDIQFHRLFRRIAEGSPVHFSMDLVSHEGDWRGGMRWMTARYPEYFNPPLASAHRFGGTGAYSSYEGSLDTATLKQMAFTVNWKASFDFPYQGMFIPPVADDEPWPRGYTKSESPPIELGPTTSIPQMAGYSRRMREMGFDVLNYFNASEFGKNIVYPPAARKAQPDADLWKDPNDYLNARLADALIYRPENEIATPGGPEQKDPYCRAAYGNVVLDWGEPSWQNFLLEQARLLIKKIPDSAGIAFDRLDWMRLYNFRRDDGVTWYNGPARSMVTAWKDLLEKLDPIEHPAGQVIFVNNLVSRLDTLRYVDGLFSELAYWGGNLNSTAFLGVSKPAITWVFGEYTLKQLAEQRATAGKSGEVGWVFGENSSTAEADAFLQKFLYLGLFPMAPFPQNDHSLMPSPAADRIYLDYGPMFLAMRGRKWVLWPHPVSVQGSPAKVNMFEIPDGYLISVTFGGPDSDSVVTVRGVPGIAPGKKLRCQIIHPGESDWTASDVITRGNEVTLNVPVRRGCALVKLHSE